MSSANTADEAPLTSGVDVSAADAMLSDAIRDTLAAPPNERVALFTSRVGEIARFMETHPSKRPWTVTVYRGTDGSTIFRGGVGHSLVIDTEGRVWRARSYEDFDTEYAIAATSCDIASLTPRYAEMRQYTPRTDVLQTPRMELNELTSDHVMPHVGSVFRLQTGDGRIHELKLLNVLKTYDMHIDTRMKRDTFTLTFLGPREPYLPQAAYPLTHDVFGGTQTVFIVPQSMSKDGYIYEAVFN